MSPDNKPLSSSATTYYKVVLPAVWLTGFGAASIALGFGGGHLLPLQMRIMFPLGWLLGLGLMSWLCFPLKQVSLCSSGLLVRGLKKETIIPLADIESVGGSFFTKPEIITLKLKRPSVFGARIRFAPEVRFLRASTHPTVKELSDLIAAQRA